MDKVIHVLWRGAPGERSGDGSALRGALAQRLLELGAAAVHVNVCDDAAQGAAPTFLYVQNVVSRVLSLDAPPYGAIVEEAFPPAAFGHLRAFYDAVADEDGFARHQAAMAKSCPRCIAGTSRATAMEVAEEAAPAREDLMPGGKAS
ncbi:MAG TPA: hypothetical protein PLB41_04320 [Rubrivivax sp.]|nr:hypothetical protein [Rubrivivax sp.]HPO18852.1 hypothetical protein [Rubrivivax sp.]